MMRMQFWRDALAAVFASEPSREPISLLLHSALSDLAARSPSSSPSLFPARRAHRAPYTHTASLVAAIVLHPLFECLSLGIRIAGLPDKHYGAGGGGGAHRRGAR